MKSVLIGSFTKCSDHEQIIMQLHIELPEHVPKLKVIYDFNMTASQMRFRYGKLIFKQMIGEIYD